MNDIPEYRGEFGFSYRAWHFHLAQLFSRPIFLVTTAAAVFGVLWTIGEASIQLLETNPRGLHWYGSLVLASLISAFGIRAFQYATTAPSGLEDVSRHAQRIALWQRPLWEFKLAKSLLAERLGPHDQQLSDLINGRAFVIGHKPASPKAYVDWSTSRLDNLQRMLVVAKVLILSDYPAALQSTKSKPADPKRILAETEKLARFYGTTVTFECESHAVLLPDDLQELHRLQQGWSEPIRDGVRQLFLFLQQVCESDIRRDNHISFMIEFKEIEAVNAYCRELERLGDRLPALMENW